MPWIKTTSYLSVNKLKLRRIALKLIKCKKKNSDIKKFYNGKQYPSAVLESKVWNNLKSHKCSPFSLSVFIYDIIYINKVFQEKKIKKKEKREGFFSRYGHQQEVWHEVPPFWASFSWRKLEVQGLKRHWKTGSTLKKMSDEILIYK